VNRTLSEGGNCVGLSALGASLMKKMGVSNAYALFEDNHIFLGYNSGHTMTFVYNANKNATIINIKRLW
jgi:hypothetical protein